jgi:hypothetical protein
MDLIDYLLVVLCTILLIGKVDISFKTLNEKIEQQTRMIEMLKNK